MTNELSIDQVMNAMPGAFMPEKAGDMNAIIQYHLKGDEAGDWVVRIGDGECKVEQGTVDNPRLTLEADSADYLKVLSGELNAMSAFAAGKLKLQGDLSLAMKLMSMFRLE